VKIVLVVPNLAAGGTERIVTLLAHSWAQRDHDVTIVTIDSTRDDFYEVDRRVRRVTLPPGSGERFVGRISTVMPLRRVLGDSRPDVIVSFITVTNLLTIVAAAGRRIPVVVSEQLDPREHRIPRSMKIVRSVLYRRATALVVLTEGVAEWARRRVPPRMVHVIPNFAREAALKRPPAGSGSRRVIAIGRFVDQKGFDMLLDAFAAVVADGSRSDWTLEILGDGPDRPDLEARARALGIADRVRMPGVVSDVAALLAGSEIFVLSSRYEGFPLVLCEAMAAGVPSIAFDCPSGPSELIRHRTDGILVPPGDVAALAASLGELMDDPELRSRLADRGPEVTERFPWSRALDLWTNLVSDVARR
jgi:GalNAc-alpha-(1->4)-GalNAc-alpha-(1->3)-diNAcBac-PP-undecaprenol alpha-1,4-N-acetyl-D-galactosaminyltransferase